MSALSVKRRRGLPPSPRFLVGLGRAATVFAAALLLGGCGATVRTGIDVARSLVGGGEDMEGAARKVAAGPYASLMMDDGRTTGVMVLGNDDEGRLSWHAGRRILFLCEGGLVCGTHEMAARLDGMQVEGHNPFLDLRAVTGTATVSRRYDWREGYRYGIPVTGTVRRIGSESVQILDRTRELVRYEEQLSGPDVEGTNSYWIDPATGTLWKSRQLVAPGTYIEITQLKPYRRRPQ